jgi:hypothetical protein
MCATTAQLERYAYPAVISRMFEDDVNSDLDHDMSDFHGSVYNIFRLWELWSDTSCSRHIEVPVEKKLEFLEKLESMAEIMMGVMLRKALHLHAFDARTYEVNPNDANFLDCFQIIQMIEI